ncbi:MAG: Fur family transcriptional regulator [Candidatus Methylacidiphilales bacterium]
MNNKGQRRTVEEVTNLCRKMGMRKTRALDRLLVVLMEAERPLTLAELHELATKTVGCDRATVYRCLNRLERAGIVRRLGLHERAAYYTLPDPDVHNDYLICTVCGAIAPLLIECPVHELEEQISREYGFIRLHHELEFFGICPVCQKSSKKTKSV